MKKIDLGQSISILANIGVIAGIVFLGIELQQNNETLSVQSRLDREDLFRQGIARKFEHPGMFRAIAKAKRGELLSDEEQLLLDWENHALLIDWMLVYMQVHDDLLDEATIQIELWRISLHEGLWPGLEEYWSNNKRQYRPEFVQWMDENVASGR